MSDTIPKTVRGLKSMAKRIKRDEGIQHAKALDRAAVTCGFQSYQDAARKMAP